MTLKALIVAMGLTMASAAHAACPSAQVSELGGIVDAMYGALSPGDVARARTFLDPDFYIFEGGVRMGGDQILGMIDSLRARGLTYRWSVNSLDGRVSCSDGWIAYVNRGSITDPKGTKSVSWLESAALHYDGKSWKILFMHSTRKPDSK